MNIDEINRLSQKEFMERLGWIFESSPWVAERAWCHGPFASLDALHAAMVAEVEHATTDEQLALLRAHPDLATRAGRASALSAASRGEQAGAGLDRLSERDYERFGQLNARYRERFGFPFIIAVRKHDTASILAAFERRLHNPVGAEMEAALSEIADITRFRLATLVTT